MKIDRIIGGAESACVLSVMDALRAVLNETGEQRSRLVNVAKAALQAGMHERVNLERPNTQSHLEQMLADIDAMDLAAVEAAQNAKELATTEVDVDALLRTALDDIDLEDEALFTNKSDLEAHLASVGADMARRYSLSDRAFWLERTSYKGQSFLGIGTSSGPHPRFPGQDFNVFCTTNGYRTIKDAGDDLIVFADGRQLTKGEDRDGRQYFIRFAPISTHRTWRFWGSTNKNGKRQDVESLKFTIQLDETKPKGYVVTRMQGRTVYPDHQLTAGGV